MRFPALLALGCFLAMQSFAGDAARFTYGVEWRLIHAGQTIIESRGSSATLRMESSGMVAKLFKVDDTYSVDYRDAFCAISSLMASQEGKRHREARVTYDHERTRAFYTERDVDTGSMIRTADVGIPACVHDVVGALLKLRHLSIAPGSTVELPVSDGRKSASVKIHAQDRDQIKTSAGSFKTIRYEADLMNGIVYTRKGRVLIWLTDDDRRLPVQIRLRMNFPIGTVTLALEKEESL